MRINSRFSEDILIEQTAIEIFQSLGFRYLNCFEEKFGKDGDLGRESRSEVIITSRLKKALKSFKIITFVNPSTTRLYIKNIIKKILK